MELGKEQRMEASQHVFKNYKEFVQQVGEEYFDFKIVNEEDVWKHVHPTKINIRKRYKDNSVYIAIYAECDWEDEHGLQIVYKNGNELSRVSDQDGHLTYSDAYGLPESEDRIC